MKPEEYETPAVEERTRVEEPLNIINSSDGTQRETPVWRTR